MNFEGDTTFLVLEYEEELFISNYLKLFSCNKL